MQNVFPHVRRWFLEKEEHFGVFAEADSRLEGWLKGEFLVLLSRLKSDGLVDRFVREAGTPTSQRRNRVDVLFEAAGVVHLCELKALCISQAAGTPRNLRFYFREDGVGLIKDFRKMDAVKMPQAKKWVFGFVYPSPSADQWDAAVASLSSDVSHWRCVTGPQSFPRHLFVSLWTPAADALSL